MALFVAFEGVHMYLYSSALYENDVQIIFLGSFLGS